MAIKTFNFCPLWAVTETNIIEFSKTTTFLKRFERFRRRKSVDIL